MKVELFLPSGRELTIKFDNILDARLFEALQECIFNNVNYVELSKHLEDISKNGIPNLQKV